MKYKPYPKYKDSGVEWLGEIPDGWECHPLFTVLPEHYEPNNGMQSEEVLSLSYGQIVKKDVSDNYGLLPESFETYQLVQPDDIILRLTDLQNDQRSLRTAISQYHGIITSAYLKLRCSQSSSFYHWLLHSADTQKVFYGLGGGVRQSMKFSDLKRFPIVVPPLPTQRAIAAFLDAETARIDSLIKDYEDLIELLKEKRQALISHAVTRGLSELVSPDDPEFGEWAKPVKFKDSGVEWIGEIPEGWSIPAIGYHYEIQLGKMLDAGQITGNQLFPYLRNQDVQWNNINLENLPEMDFSESDKEKYSLKIGDLLVCEGGDVGRAAVWTFSNSNIFYQKALHRLRPIDIKLNTPKYLLYLLMMANGNNIFIGGEEKATIFHLTADRLKKFRFPYPKRPEQSAISSFLDRETSKLDTLVTESQSAIELLKEHRSALITNAVTGKINVEALG